MCFFDIQYKSGKLFVSGLTNELNSIFLDELYKNSNNDILIICNSLFEATKLYESISLYNEDVVFFPMDEFLTSEAIAISPELKSVRIDTINKICFSKKNKIVITNLMGYLRFLPPKSNWIENIKIIKKNDSYNIKKFVEYFYNLGYNRETIVNSTGDIGVRGFVVDVFLLGENYPVRFEFWGDSIESIKYFDPTTQKSIKEIENIKIVPNTEFILPSYEKETEKKQKYLCEFYNNIFGIANYIENPVTVFLNYNQLKNSYNILEKEIFDYKISNNEEFKYMNDFDYFENNNIIYLSTIDNKVNEVYDESYYFDSRDISDLNINLDNIDEILSKLMLDNNTVVLCLKKLEEAKYFDKYIRSNKIILTNESNIKNSRINVIKKEISEGFIFQKTVYISENDIFKRGERKTKYRSKYKFGSKIKDYKKLNIGDYVVHNVHGIGKYHGIETLIKKGLKKDYLNIEYKNKDKLYIPVEKIDYISKYSAGNTNIPKLNKLGGIEWQKTKSRVKEKIENIAGDLLKIAAERKMKLGFKFSEDSEEQILFESQFNHIPTKDQLFVIDQIKKDMEKSSPMDRLVCGDVGFGKTEIAFRAIFKAVYDGKQVMYLCPTAILSNQHYENALRRFSYFPFNIALLNRYTKPKKGKEILLGLKNGTVDILFGTHRLLSDDVKPSNLGLLVIDEEQRFGVKHKEKIKTYNSNVDILTLTATPIPRTLQMSMLGIRDLSVIETPPVDRYPIQTYVLGYNKQVIRDAIYKELSRKGQIFILYNKVIGIQSKVEEISKLVPEAKISFAHGKMNKTELEDKMFSFVNKEYDILICTTIIETGIDIPNVNTLIIMDADHFGLSQLYQIRGRVGRTNKIAYCYLMYDNRKILGEIAIKRLDTIKNFTKLGSGFSVASKDLSIRGAGDILGKEQAGQIDSIGIELYLRLLKEEIDKRKGVFIESNFDVEEKPFLDVETHISDKYVEDGDLKILIHKKINEINNYEKLMTIKEEIEDRFGKINEQILIYMYEEWFEKVCKRLEVEKVIQKNKNIEIILSKNISNKINGESLFIKSYEISKQIKFKYIGKKLRIIFDVSNLKKHYIYYLIELFNEIENNKEILK